MRFLRLDLLAFGPFTERSLDLHAGQFGLHLIYGPNEAGKSSALRALRQLLYGIEVRSSDNFLHGYSSLRVGAVLQGPDGDRLHVIRRKGNKDTLRGADDRQIVDAGQLDRLLNGVGMSDFQQRFGIDHQELVTGSRDILQGGGQLGRLLFAAGAGLADLNRTQAHLDEEAEQYFKARGANPRINGALSQLQTARKALKEAQLRPAEWSEHSGALQAAVSEKEAVDRRLAERQAELRRLERLRQALPLMARLQRLEDEMTRLADAPSLPDGFGEQRLKAADGLKRAQAESQDAQQALEEIQAKIAELQVSDALLSAAPLLGSLPEELGAYRKAHTDRPGLVANRNRSEDEARETLRELQRDVPLDQAESLRLSGPQSKRIGELSNRWHELSTRLAAAEKTVDELQLQIDAAQRHIESCSPVPDTAGLQRAVRRVRRAGDPAARLAEAQGELKRVQQQADLDLQKLGLWNGPLEQLESLPVPSRETIECWELQINESNTERKDLQRRVSDEQSALDRLQAQIEHHDLRQETVTEDDLLQARRRRDEGWQLVQTAWRGEPVDPEQQARFVAQFQQAEDLAQAYRSSVERADEIADRLRRESQQVAEKARLVSELHQRQTALERLAEASADAQQRWADGQRQWSDLWSPLGIQPLSPREMLAWLGRQDGLLRRAQELRQHDLEIEELQAAIAELSGELLGEVEALGQPLAETCSDLSLVDLLDHCEQLLEQCDRQRGQRRDAQRDLQRLCAQLPAAGQEADRAARDLDAWREQWAQAMSTLDLPPTASSAEADEVTARLARLAGCLKEIRSLNERIAGIDREAELFRNRVAEAARAVAPELVDVPVQQAVPELLSRLRAAQDARTRLEGLQEQQNAAEKRLQKAHREATRLTAQLAALCEEAGCESPGQLKEVEQRASERRECADRLDQVRDQLIPLAAGGSLQQLRDEAMGVDSDQLEPEIVRLQEELAALETRREQQIGTIEREKVVLQQMDGSGRAAAADDEIQALLAQIRTDTEQFVRLRLAALVLRQAIERYREKNQGPLLQRANRLFAALTLGSFAGLRDDYNDKGEPVLVGLRGDGRSMVGVEGMSDGSRDQLYLSLRLASLEYYLEQNPPLPFIVDDILIQFDDQRAAAALRVLADLSTRTQVIFFTHHAHLVDLARDEVAADRLFVHEL
jgi:uncharacterized protein YhaN